MLEGYVEPRCTYKISGPKIKGLTPDGKDDPDKAHAAAFNHFATLTFGDGLTLRYNGEESSNGKCDYTLSSEGGGGGGCSEGVSATVNVVSKVCCDGATFAITRQKLTFADGCLTNVEPAEDDQECD